MTKKQKQGISRVTKMLEASLTKLFRSLQLIITKMFYYLVTNAWGLPSEVVGVIPRNYFKNMMIGKSFRSPERNHSDHLYDLETSDEFDGIYDWLMVAPWGVVRITRTKNSPSPLNFNYLRKLLG